MTQSTQLVAVEQPDLSLTRDFEILDRYQAFSAELLRLALLGITGLGFLVTTVADKDSLKALRASLASGTTDAALAVALLSFVVTAAAALGHRYWSADSMACHIHLLRLRATGKSGENKALRERKARDRDLARSSMAIGVASVALSLGALALAAASWILLRGLSRVG